MRGSRVLVWSTNEPVCSPLSITRLGAKYQHQLQLVSHLTDLESEKLICHHASEDWNPFSVRHVLTQLCKHPSLAQTFTYSSLVIDWITTLIFCRSWQETMCDWGYFLELASKAFFPYAVLWLKPKEDVLQGWRCCVGSFIWDSSGECFRIQTPTLTQMSLAD